MGSGSFRKITADGIIFVHFYKHFRPHTYVYKFWQYLYIVYNLTLLIYAEFTNQFSLIQFQCYLLVLSLYI